MDCEPEVSFRKLSFWTMEFDLVSLEELEGRSDIQF